MLGSAASVPCSLPPSPIPVVSIVGVLISVVALLATFFHNKAGTKRDAVKATLEYLNEWRSAEFTAARRYVMEDFRPRITKSMTAGGYSGLTGKDAEDVRRVSYFLEYLGTMMAAQHLNEELIILEIGQPVTKLWETLGGFIRADRINRNYDGYQRGFEHLAARAHDKYSEIVGGIEFETYKQSVNPGP